MKVKATIHLDLSIPDASIPELTQIIFDAYLNYSVIKHSLEALNILSSSGDKDIDERLKINNEKALELENLYCDILNQAVWVIEKEGHQTKIDVFLDFPESYSSFSESEMRQVISDILVQYACVSHAEDATKYCSEAGIGSTNEKESSKRLFDYHETWRDICKNTLFSVDVEPTLPNRSKKISI